MVDTITGIGEEVVETIFHIAPDNLFIQPDHSFAEAGLIENAAQTCSAIVARSFFVDDDLQDKEEGGVIGFISAIKTLKVFSLPKSGDTIRTKSALVSSFVTDEYSLCTMHCQTFLGETLLLDGKINLFIKQQESGPSVVKSNA